MPIESTWIITSWASGTSLDKGNWGELICLILLLLACNKAHTQVFSVQELFKNLLNDGEYAQLLEAKPSRQQNMDGKVTFWETFSKSKIYFNHFVKIHDPHHSCGESKILMAVNCSWSRNTLHQQSSQHCYSSAVHILQRPAWTKEHFHHLNPGEKWLKIFNNTEMLVVQWNESLLCQCVWSFRWRDVETYQFWVSWNRLWNPQNPTLQTFKSWTPDSDLSDICTSALDRLDSLDCIHE